MDETLAVTSGSTAPPLETTRRDAPFGKKQLLYTGLFLNVFGVALMAALNWRRLGKPVRIWWILALAAIFLVLTAFIFTLVGSVVARQNGMPFYAGGWALPLMISTACNIVFAFLAARLQKREYSAWIAAHGAREPTFRERGGWGGFLAIVITSSVLGLLYGGLVAPLILIRLANPVMAMVNPPTVFSDPAFEMTYSGAWWSVNSSLRDHLTCEQVECVLWLNQGYGQTRILVMRSGTLLDRMASLEDTAELVWAGVQSAGGELIQEPAALEVGGQPAQQAVFSDGQSVTLLTITKQPDRSFIVIRADTPTDGSADALADVEAIISSIRFK